MPCRLFIFTRFHHLRYVCWIKTKIKPQRGAGWRVPLDLPDKPFIDITYLFFLISQWMLHALRSTSKGLAASEINTNHSQDHYQTIFSTTGILALITSAEGESIGEPGIFIYQNSLVDVPRRRRKQITLSLECSSTVSVRNLALEFYSQRYWLFLACWRT